MSSHDTTVARKFNHQRTCFRFALISLPMAAKASAPSATTPY